MPARVLNESFIKTGLICPPDKHQIEYTDADRTGLYIEVRASGPGQSTYWFRYKDATGKTARVKLGRVFENSLKDIKSRVRTIRAEIQLGADPSAEKRQRKQVPTWNTFFTDWYLPHAKQHKRSWANDEEMHRLRISARFGNLRLDQIRRQPVQQFHSELRESGLAPATCDHHLKLIRQALNLAVDWELIKVNPVARVTLFHVSNAEERLLSSEQLRDLMAVLDTDKNRTVCLVVKFLLFTGARVNEALHARWADIDRPHRTWTIEATNSKSKRRRSVPLSDAALLVLNQLRSEGKSDWLFNSSRGGGRLTCIGKVWTRIRRAAGLERSLDGGLNFRLHDARHAAASAMISNRQSLYTVQKILGHSDPSVTQRYAHLSTEALQDAANSIGRYVEKALENNVDS